MLLFTFHCFQNCQVVVILYFSGASACETWQAIKSRTFCLWRQRTSERTPSLQTLLEEEGRLELRLTGDPRNAIFSRRDFLKKNSFVFVMSANDRGRWSTFEDKVYQNENMKENDREQELSAKKCRRRSRKQGGLGLQRRRVVLNNVVNCIESGLEKGDKAIPNNSVRQGEWEL